MDKLSSKAQFGDLAQLVSPTNKTYTFRITQGAQLQTHRGILKHDDLVGLAWGSQVFSHIGSTYFMLPPALGSLITESRRSTQIMYPKDIGFLLVTMGIGYGTHVIEAGTGSGALTTALTWAVGPEGHVYSYDVRPEVQKLALKNLVRLGLEDRVTLRVRDISEGFIEKDVHALFLDLPNPFDYLSQVRNALMPGGFFGCILPTVTQVSRLLTALNQYDFVFVDVCEVLLRYYKPNPVRLRPTDRMVAHTGYLIFARPFLAAPGIEISDEEDAKETDEMDSFNG